MEIAKYEAAQALMVKIKDLEANVARVKNILESHAVHSDYIWKISMHYAEIGNIELKIDNVVAFLESYLLGIEGRIFDLRKEFENL